MEKSAVNKIEKLCHLILKYIFSVFIGFISAKIGIRQDLSPFSLSVMSILPFTKLNLISMFFGSFIGHITKVFLISNFKYICANIVMFAIILLSGNNFYKKYFSPVLPAAICFTVGFVFLFSQDFTIISILLLLCESVICGCIAYFIKYSYNSISNKVKLKSKDLISINITIIIIICALDNYYIFTVPLSIIFTILLIYYSAYFFEMKVAILFTSTLCAVPAILNPNNSYYFILLYIPSVVSIIISRFEKKHIITSYILSYFALYTMNFQKLNFNITFSPLYAAILFILSPKKKMENVLSDYISINQSSSDKKDSDELCFKYSQASKDLLKSIENTTVKPLVDFKSENKIKKYMKLNNCRNISISNLYNDSGKQIITVHCEPGENFNANKLKNKISEICKNDFIIKSENVHNGNMVCCFEQSEQYKIECCAFYKSKRSETICGDSITAFKSPDKNYYLIIADGMGSGKEAYNKSYNTVTLLKKLLKSSNDLYAAIDAVNSSIDFLKDEIGFSTLDLCRISLTNASAEFVKCGANNSYVLRENKTYCINNGGFPIGLNENVSYKKCFFQLKNKDIIVMASDGISLSEENIQRLLLSGNGKSIESIAKELIEETEKNIDYEDDKSVLVALVKKNNIV